MGKELGEKEEQVDPSAANGIEQTGGRRKGKAIDKGPPRSTKSSLRGGGGGDGEPGEVQSQGSSSSVHLS